MTENRTIHLVEIPIGGREGAIWNRLHGEREDICESLIKLDGPADEANRELLQARLRNVDKALDRLMAGPYSECDGSDAIAEGDVVLENLKPFDTIMMQTSNSDYRILLLDPKTGRALIEGGRYLVEPTEALLKGSAVPGSAFKGGSLSVGSQMEMWVDERVLLTSAITSVHVEGGHAV